MGQNFGRELARKRLAVPATTDYWVNDRSGDPLFVVTAEANAALMRMLEPILQETRARCWDRTGARQWFSIAGDGALKSL
jgi:hypothetical protein